MANKTRFPMFLVLITLGTPSAHAGGLCELTKNTAELNYADSVEAERHQEYQNEIARRWHEANLAIETLKAFREVVETQPGYSDAKDSIIKAVRIPPNERQAPEVTAARTLIDSMKALRKNGYYQKTDTCEKGAAASRSTPEVGKIKWRAISLLPGAPDQYTVKEEVTEVCHYSDVAKMPERFGDFEIDSNAETLTVSAYDNTHGTGKPVKITLSVAQFLGEPLPYPAEFAPALARGLEDDIGLTMEDFKLEQSKDVCAREASVELGLTKASDETSTSRPAQPAVPAKKKKVAKAGKNAAGAN